MNTFLDWVKALFLAALVAVFGIGYVIFIILLAAAPYIIIILFIWWLFFT